MSVAAFAGWLGTLVTIAGYLLSVIQRRPRIFHAANTIGVTGVAWSAIAEHAWPNLALTLCFGLIGIAGLAQTTRRAERRRLFASAIRTTP